MHDGIIICTDSNGIEHSNGMNGLLRFFYFTFRDYKMIGHSIVTKPVHKSPPKPLNYCVRYGLCQLKFALLKKGITENLKKQMANEKKLHKKFVRIFL